jgi:hypothetical protein
LQGLKRFEQQTVIDTYQHRVGGSSASENTSQPAVTTTSTGFAGGKFKIGSFGMQSFKR